MVFSRISSYVLRRNPFTSRPIYSSSSIISISDNFSTISDNFSTISNFNFSNPRNANFLHVRKCWVEATNFDLRKEMTVFRLKLTEANDALELAQESQQCFPLWPYYKDEAQRAANAITDVLATYEGLMSKLDEDEKEDFEKTEASSMEAIKRIREELLSDELMNYAELAQKLNEAISIEEEEHKGSGGMQGGA